MLQKIRFFLDKFQYVPVHHGCTGTKDSTWTGTRFRTGTKYEIGTGTHRCSDLIHKKIDFWGVQRTFLTL